MARSHRGATPVQRIVRGLRLLAVTALAAAAVATMVGLGLWQWERGQARDRFLNYSYALEWWLFAVLTVIGLVHLVRVGARGADEQPPPGTAGASGPVVGPPLAPGEELEEVTWVRLRRRLGLERAAAGNRGGGTATP